MQRLVYSLVPIGLATPAIAHPGDHARMSFVELVQHYAEPDHLVFLALTVIVGCLAYRWGRRVEAQAQARTRMQSVRWTSERTK